MTTNTTTGADRPEHDRAAQPLTLSDLKWAHGLDRDPRRTGEHDTKPETVAARVAMLREYLDRDDLAETDRSARTLLDYLTHGEQPPAPAATPDAASVERTAPLVYLPHGLGYPVSGTLGEDGTHTMHVGRAEFASCRVTSEVGAWSALDNGQVRLVVEDTENTEDHPMNGARFVLRAIDADALALHREAFGLDERTAEFLDHQRGWTIENRLGDHWCHVTMTRTDGETVEPETGRRALCEAADELRRTRVAFGQNIVVEVGGHLIDVRRSSELPRERVADYVDTACEAADRPWPVRGGAGDFDDDIPF